MKDLPLNKQYKCLASLLAVVMNGFLLLAIPSNDLMDWLLKLVELITCIKIGLNSWKWRSVNDTSTRVFFNTTPSNK